MDDPDFPLSNARDNTNNIRFISGTVVMRNAILITRHYPVRVRIRTSRFDALDVLTLRPPCTSLHNQNLTCGLFINVLTLLGRHRSSLEGRPRQWKYLVQTTCGSPGDRSFWNVLCLQPDVLLRLHQLLNEPLHCSKWPQNPRERLKHSELLEKVQHQLPGRRFSSESRRHS